MKTEYSQRADGRWTVWRWEISDMASPWVLIAVCDTQRQAKDEAFKAKFTQETR